MQWAREWLGRKGAENPRLDAELLLAHALRCDRVRLYIDADKPLAAEELARFKSLIKRRGEREPVAYILGTKEFYGRSFAVGAGVFIPRPETELLVRMVTEHLARDAEARVLDLCAGSGAVGISVAAERPRARVDLVELSADAAAVARANAAKHAPGRVRVSRAICTRPCRKRSVTMRSRRIRRTCQPLVWQDLLRMSSSTSRTSRCSRERTASP